MPSPFPGMDPFLENPELFPSLHHGMITFLQEALQPRLPENYVATCELRVWLEAGQRQVVPDVNVHRRRRTPGGVRTTTVAAATRTKPAIIRIPIEEHREAFVNIHAQHDRA